MTKVLLFGAGGQLGQEIVARAPAFKIDIAAHSRHQTDIADPGMVAAAIHAATPNVLVNAAAYTKVDKAESEPDEAHRVNSRAHALLRKLVPPPTFR
jgi:dTDP-4-dehydrorhamnose reductase